MGKGGPRFLLLKESVLDACWAGKAFIVLWLAGTVMWEGSERRDRALVFTLALMLMVGRILHLSRLNLLFGNMVFSSLMPVSQIRSCWWGVTSSLCKNKRAWHIHIVFHWYSVPSYCNVIFYNLLVFKKTFSWKIRKTISRETRQYCDQMIKTNMTNEGKMDFVCLQIWCPEKDTPPLRWFSGPRCIVWIKSWGNIKQAQTEDLL